MCVFMVSSSVAQREKERESVRDKESRGNRLGEKTERERDSERRLTSFCRLGESGSVDP